MMCTELTNTLRFYFAALASRKFISVTKFIFGESASLNFTYFSYLIFFTFQKNVFCILTFIAKEYEKSV